MYAQDTVNRQLKLPKDSVLMTLNKAKTSKDSLKKDSVKSTKSEGIDAPVSYRSEDSIHFLIKTKKITLYGQGEIDYEDLILKSENVELDMFKREVYARGKKDSLGNYRGRPDFKQGEEAFDSDTLKYSFDSKKGLVYGLVTKQEDGYLHSEKTKILPNKEVNVKNGKFTTCDEEHPHFYVAMTKALVIPNDKIVTGPAYLVIEDVPIPIVVPFGFFPNKKGRANGILLPTFGNDQVRGYYLKDGGIYFGIGEYADLTLKGDIYTFGSWRIASESNYTKLYKFNGNLSYTYANLKDNIDPNKKDKSFSIKWNHTQDPKASKYGSFGANVNFQTAGHSQHNAQSMNDYLSPSISSSITYSKSSIFKIANLSISGLHNQNLTDSIISVSLPNVSLSATSLTPFKRRKSVGKSHWYEDIRVGYTFDGKNKLSDVKMDSTFFSKATLDRFQMGMQHTASISTTFKLLKYFSLSPGANINDRWLFDRIDRYWSDTLTNKGSNVKGGIVETNNRDFNSVWDYSFNTSLSTNIYGMFVFKNKILKAIRHKMTPSISYNFTPSFGQYWSTYKDKYGDRVYYSPYSKSFYSTPSQIKSSSIGFNLSNNLELKVRNRKDTVTYTKKIALIDNFTIASSYNLAADSLQWSYIRLSGTTNLFKRISVQYSSNLDPYRVGRNKNGIIQGKNELMFDEYGRLWRIDNSQLTLSTSLQLGPSKENVKPQNTNRNKTAYFSDFTMPWNLNITYSWSLPRKYYYTYYNTIDSITSKISQTLGVNGTINFTKNWKMSYATGWDFVANKISYTKFDFYRDLHCWDLSFMWIPFGGMQRYEFTVKVKAGMLKDLKVDKKKSYGNVY